ncbi:MAG: hypothetical protein AAF960_08310 [Bacteroidota bacterium]
MRRIVTSATLGLLLFLPTYVSATVSPIQLLERIEQSGQIVMAKAIAAESYWDANHKNIYTAYTMEAKVYMKINSVATTFQFIIPGGEVDGELEIVTPNVQMSIGQEYMLMLKTASSSALKPNAENVGPRTPQFQPFAHVQGVLPKVNGRYVDYNDVKPMVEWELMEIVEAVTKMKPVTPDGTIYIPQKPQIDLDNDGVCAALDCDDNDPNFPKPVGAPCNDNNSQTENDQIQADGCTCAGNLGTTANCESLTFTVQGSTIRIDNLTAKHERIEFIGLETNGQTTFICDGNCLETQYIDGLIPGNKIIRVFMTGADGSTCDKEVVLEIKDYIYLDSDNDNIYDIKDCAPNDASLPAIPGNSCDDGNPNTINDLILIDGCTCAGVPTCASEESVKARLAVVAVKNGKGDINPVFIAGTIESDNDLVLEGSGFGDAIGSIQFANSDSGGRSVTSVDQSTDFVSWTDTQIRVKVPTRSGTGTVIVKNTAGSVVGTTEITVAYAISSLYSSFRSFPAKTRQNIKFTNRNEAGGYTMQLNAPSGFANSTAVAPFERAANTWICNSGVNWQIDKAGTTTGFGNDGHCVVLFEPNLPIGVLGITTSRYKASGNSSCSGHNTVWYLKEFDIQLLPNHRLGNSFEWNFSEAPPSANQFDFQTIVLHELGHAHGLGHVINGEEVMHYSVTHGTQSRTVTPHAHEASLFKMALSTQPNCMSRHEPMIQLAHSCFPITQPKSTSARVKLLLEGFYDTNDGMLNTNLLDNELLPNDQPYDEADYSMIQAATVENFPTNIVDWVVLELRDKDDRSIIIAQKPVLVKNDGTLVDVDGASTITFDNLEDQPYYLAIFHKSHLPIISNAAQPLSDDPTVFDFSASPDATMGTNQQKNIDGKYFMNSGDFDGNGVINSLDFNFWKQAGAAVNAYSPADADGNGIINVKDFNLWKANGSKISVLSGDN